MDQDEIFQQASLISKAHAYDILVKQVWELQEENTRLRKLTLECNSLNQIEVRKMKALEERNERLTKALEAILKVFTPADLNSNDQFDAILTAKTTLRQEPNVPAANPDDLNDINIG